MSDGIIGTTMVAHKILPRAKTILNISVGLSDKAKQRSKWIDWYYAHGSNKRLTARHFGLSPNTFYKWLRRYQSGNLKSLQNKSTRPRRHRLSPIPTTTIELINSLRKDDMGLSKYKLSIILLRDHQIYYYNHNRIHLSLKTNPYQFYLNYLLNKTIDKLS